MANVVDPNSWRMMSARDPGRGNQPSVAGDRDKTNNAASVPPPPHMTLPPGAAASADTVPAESWTAIAARTLAALARQDDRVMVVTTHAEHTRLEAWHAAPDRLLAAETDVSHALDWCAHLAAAGNRPFAFLSCDEVLDNLGRVRRDICRNGLPATLLVEARRQHAEPQIPGSAILSGIRPLPHLSLLAPKDGGELVQMLRWCAAQEGPAAIWLPEEDEPQITWPVGAEIELGRGERLGQGRDVVIIAWGPMVAAAGLAAESLALGGIGVTVINARFAQPLDIEMISRSIQQAAYVVIVDDADQTGGFGGWVLEELSRSDAPQRIAIVAPPADAIVAHPHDARDRCAMAIVAHCRWLSEPILTSVPLESMGPATTVEAGGSDADDWMQFVATRAGHLARERAQVLTTPLSQDTQRWVTAYEEVGGRDLYLWKWCTQGVELTTLPCVVPELRAHVCDTKLLSIVLCVLLDDVADEHGNSHLLDALLETTCWGASRSLEGLSASEKRHAAVTRALWSEYWSRVSGYPCHDAFEPVLRYDLLQFLNTMRYSHLVNGRPYLVNVAEHDLYTSHNMMIISFATLDLMCSPDFPREEVGALRETIWHAQCMGRIGNLLSTWRRELAKGDFTSGVFARALMEGDITHDDLRCAAPQRLETVIRNRGHEAFFFRKWLEHRQQCHTRAKRITSLNLRAVLDAHDRFFDMHMGSKGLI